MPLVGMINIVLRKLKEKSTYVGLMALASAAGLKWDAEQWSSIAGVVIAAVGLYEVFRREK
jgi:hypothetical protein